MTQHSAHCLLLIDLQRAFVESDTAVPASAVLVEAARAQLKAARAANSAVVHLQNDGQAGAADEPGSVGWSLVLDAKPEEVVIRKVGDDGFDGTGLHELLRGLGVTALSVCGLLSEMCVAATARTAMRLGYRVVLAHDSHATYPVPAYGPTESPVPAAMAARAAEWSLGDAILLPAHGADIQFTAVEP
jgi:streptothricin hydrolase